MTQTQNIGKDTLTLLTEYNLRLEVQTTALSRGSTPSSGRV